MNSIARTHIFALLVIALGISGVAAQEKQQPAYMDIVQQGQDAYNEKDYLKAAELYAKALEDPECARTRVYVIFNLSCCYSLAGDGPKAFNALQWAIESGYDNVRHMNRDTDLEFLRANHADEYAALLARIPELKEQALLTLSPIAVLEYDNYLGPINLDRYRWDDLDNPLMDSLRKTYNLDSIMSAGKTEFDRQKLLLNWVANSWKHTGDNGCSGCNAFDILERVAKGEQFRCVEYGIVLANCLTAVGYPARVISLRMDGVAYETGKGHIATEVWSNEYGKWLILDGQNNAWWEADGVPLSSPECQELLLSGRESELKMVGQTPNVNYESRAGSWGQYFYHLVGNTYNLFFDKADSGNIRWQYLPENALPELYFQGSPSNLVQTSDLNLAYPDLNLTRIELKHHNKKEQSDTLLITLQHTMPYFDRFDVRFDSGDWITQSETLTWVLKPDNNVIEARAISKFGIAGPISRIALKNNLHNDGS